MNQPFHNTVSLAAGSPFPLGARPLPGGGVNFALFSRHAEAVELCLFEDRDPGGNLRESHRYRLRHHTDGVWHGVCETARPGTAYGYRVYGPHGPGMRFEPERLALDPYARHLAADPNDPVVRAAGGPPAIVPEASDDFDWSDDRAPRIPWTETVLYEAHVKGLTATHPELPEAERGTFAALASDVMLDHYRRLGVTSLELLPIQQRLDEAHLVRQGLTNYWGYNTIAFFVPDERFRSVAHPGDAARQLKAAVRRLHQAGIEGDPGRRIQSHRRRRPGPAGLQPEADRQFELLSRWPGRRRSICGRYRLR